MDHHSFGTLDTKQLDDELDGDDDLENEEERRQELKEALSMAFDDLSSIDDAEDEEDTDEKSMEHCRRAPVLSQDSISTPRFFGDKFNRLNNISVIEEEVLSMDGERKDETNDNLRLLLQENERLSTENSKLETQVNILAGDFEGLSFKHRQLQEAFDQKDRLINELKGELNAQDLSRKTHAEALKATQAKVAVSESTIESLRTQLSEMARSDCIERVRDQHERQVHQMKDTFDNERFKLLQDKNSLKEMMDEKDRKITHLRLELDLLKKSQKERRQSTSDSETVRRLKSELEAVNENNLNLKHQLETANNSIKDAKSEAAFYAADSQAKQAELNGFVSELEQHKSVIQRQDLQMTAMKESQRKSDDMNESLKVQIQDLITMSKTLQEKNKRLGEQITSLKKTLPKTPPDPDDEFISKKSLPSLIERSTKEWKERVERLFERSFQEQVSQIKNQYQEEVRIYKETVQRDIDLLVNWIKDLDTHEDPPMQPSPLVDPIYQVCSCLQTKFREQVQLLTSRKQEIDKALQDLEEAYIDSKSESDGSKHDDSMVVVDSVRTELEAAKTDIVQLNEKLIRYKRQYHLIKNSIQKTEERRQAEFVQIIRKKFAGSKQREEALKQVVSRDATMLLQQINRAYSDSIKILKEQNDKFLEKSNNKSLEKMSQAIVNYHDIVMKKIEQRSHQLQKDLQASICQEEVDHDVSVLENLPSVLLH